MISDDLSNRSTVPRTISRSRSAFGNLFSQKSFKLKTSNHGSDQESSVTVRVEEITIS